MYKIGNTVKTEFGIGVVKDKYENLNNHFVINIRDVDIIVHVSEMEHYKTAHDKLIELGWEYKGFVELRHIYEKKYPYKFKEHIIIFPKSKFYLTSTNSKGHSVLINIELSRILTQYLEELEEKKYE